MLNLPDLAADLADMRRGRGPRLVELRRLLAGVDPVLKKDRNIEALRLANLSA
jgi:hypothetical protein